MTAPSKQPDGELAVVQADRDAAASLIEAIAPFIPHSFPWLLSAETWRNGHRGKVEHTFVPEAFARHRLRTQPDAPSGERALREALERLEAANDAVAAATTRERYLTDLADVQPALLELDDARSAARAALSASATTQQEGWRWVPVEPTEAMLDRFVSRALCVSVHGDGGWTGYARQQWAAMLAAAPTPGVGA